MLLQSLFRKDRAVLAILIDPDKTDSKEFKSLLSLLPVHSPDLILLGGSSRVEKDMDLLVDEIRLRTHVPIILFPGSAEQLTPKADGLFLCSLISGRNPDYLIGEHVNHALEIKALELPVWPIGYILLEGHQASSTSLFTQTTPLPLNNPRKIVQTAIAGELLGMKAVYLEAGSGAERCVSPELISLVSQNVQIPVIVGGGIQGTDDLQQSITSGAAMVVLGTVVEEGPNQLPIFVDAILQGCLA